jgi:hypothetical protein
MPPELILKTHRAMADFIPRKQRPPMTAKPFLGSTEVEGLRAGRRSNNKEGLLRPDGGSPPDRRASEPTTQ